MTDAVEVTLRHSPLDAVHRRLGAKMVGFGGWDMPVSYPTGTIEEHLACRNAAVVFDVSHLGTVRVEGAGSFEALQWALTNDLAKVAPGRAQYTHLLDPDDASVADDMIVWWLPDAAGLRSGAAGERGAARFDVMPNASNTDGVTAALAQATARTSGAVRVEDTTGTRAVLAVQGPEARARVATFAPEAASVGRFWVAEIDICGAPCVVAGTGYTGEDGIEIAAPAHRAEAVWDALAAAGIIPAGLGARDTLRLEAGLPLHGHELGKGLTTLQAGLGWVVGAAKADYRGSEALEAERAAGITRRLVGLALDGRQPAREGAVVSDGLGDAVGFVSSGNFSPTLGHAIALAFVRPSLAVGDAVSIDVRGRPLPARVVALPFVSKKTLPR